MQTQTSSQPANSGDNINIHNKGDYTDNSIDNSVDYTNYGTINNNNAGDTIIDNNNVNTNTNVNNNVNTNNVNVNNVNNNNVNQVNNNNQNQQQSQTQTQSVNIALPQDANGILISNRGQSASSQTPTFQLDVGKAKQSRYMPKGEVLVYEITPGNIVSIKAATDIAMYSIGTFPDDDLKVISSIATPTYDPVFHRMDFGSTAVIDWIDYWTTEADLQMTDDAKYVVIDNRAPNAQNTHIDVSGVNKLHYLPVRVKPTLKLFISVTPTTPTGNYYTDLRQNLVNSTADENRS
jgi:hypothetical protein